MGRYHTDFHLDKVFKEKDEYIKYNFEIYHQIYDLETIYYDDNVSEGLFEYCKKKNFFILLGLYDEDGKIFLERNLQETLYWSLPGGSIHKEEDMHCAVKRVASYILTDNSQKILLGEIEPVSFIQNTFKYNGEQVVHNGIAFIARVRNKKNLSLDNTLGSFIKLNEEEIQKINRYANREVAKLCHKKFKFFSTPFPENEIAVNEAQKWKYGVHDFVKRFILNNKLKRKKKFFRILLDNFRNAKSILDVSCGDSKLIFEIADRIHPDFAVANDISWSQIDTFQAGDSKGIIFTNHNAAYLPFVNNSFDVAYCGNTLHHLTSKKELAKVFESAFMISRKIVFVEIEKPSDTGFFPYLLNKYWYVGFLKDAGGAYLSKDDFHSIINGYFHDKAKISFSEFKNIQGRYLIAVVEKATNKTNSIIEVEEKYYLNNRKNIIEKLKSRNFFRYPKDEYEKDTYFSDINGEFIKNRTCLRIRERENKSEITYKGRSYSFDHFYAKVEKNIEIESETALLFEELFKSLGYVTYSVVDKKREGWFLKDGKFTHNIFIDEIKNTGLFLEIESVGNSNFVEKEEVLNANKKIVSLFEGDLNKRAFLPYRDFVASFWFNEYLNGAELKSILLDFDGTLVPSEEIFFESYKKNAKEVFNENINFSEYKKQEIYSDANLFQILKNKHLEENILEENFMKMVYDDYHVSMEKLLENEDTVINLNLIERVKKTGIKVGIVSSSKREFIDKLLFHFGKKDLFEFIITREDVVKRKPNPEPYLLALEKLQVEKKNVLVIEDTTKGAFSAKSAGLNCVISKKHSVHNEEEIQKSGFVAFVSLEQILMLVLYANK